MKYIVVLGDGMADRPVAELGGLTPLQAARKPRIDALARASELGMATTVPEGLPPASDVANLSVLGYDPRRYYTGRSPLEAVSMGIELGARDVAFRCNLVTLSEGGAYEDKAMVDYSADEISTEEARVLVAEVEKRLGTAELSFHPGISYRHCLVWKGGPEGLGLTPPHDIPLRPVRDYLPRGRDGEAILALMKESSRFLEGHPVNQARRARGKRPATSIWLWGEGRKPAIPSFLEKYGIRGSMISAVDLLKGLGLCAGLRSVEVEGATGTIHTNFAGKARAALEELKSGADFVYIHVEAPDECGHHREIEDKVRAIELIDEKVVGTLLGGLAGMGDHRILIMPDHPTPLDLRTHTADPVPFLIYDSRRTAGSGAEGYDEVRARAGGLRFDAGHELMDYFLERAAGGAGRR